MQFVLKKGLGHQETGLKNGMGVTDLTLYVPCIVTNYIYKPTRCTFRICLFYNFCTTLHVSNDHFVHHQEFMIYSILQLCTNHAKHGLYTAVQKL